MGSAEMSFLGLGLVLGGAVGAVLALLAHRRPPRQREVRLTITPNAIPTHRAPTLAVPNGTEHPGFIPGSPDEEALAHQAAPLPVMASPDPAAVTPVEPASRTRVPSGPVVLPAGAVAVPIITTPAVAEAPVIVAGSRILPDEGAFAVLVRSRAAADAARHVQAATGPPTTTAGPSEGSGAPTGTAPTPPGPRGAGVAIIASSTVASGGSPGPGTEPGPASGTPTVDATGPDAAVDPCAAPRRAVEERCALAEVVREQAKRAADALREAQRAYDTLREQVDRAEALADPRAVAAAKERLHAAFRAASDSAAGPDDTEAAARTWLGEINTLNAAVREAQRTIEPGRAGLRERLPALERLSAEADAARISGDNAEASCREAREELAACEETAQRLRDAAPVADQQPHPFDGVWPEDRPDLTREPELAPGELIEGQSLVVKVLRGDREARERVVATLAAGDAEAAREWGLRVSRLTDAIVGRAIEDGYLDLPAGDGFWRLFDDREARDIVGALSALGFRYDGMGGFADGRVPTTRDLSLAVGYAGLDRMRIRTWPREGDIAGLYARAEVAAGEWLADQAGDLSLGRMVDALGNRAADLADVWNAWGRVRPALLAT